MTPPRRALKEGRVDAGGRAEARERLRARCMAHLEKERSAKRATSLAKARNMDTDWWNEALASEKAFQALSEEEIGHILRDEYLRARAIYEEDGAREVGDVDVDEMIALEEEIAHESRRGHAEAHDAMQED